MERSNRYSVKKFVEKHSDFLTAGALRFMIYSEESNRMKEFKVVERVGRKIIINEDKFFSWLEAINQ